MPAKPTKNSDTPAGILRRIALKTPTFLRKPLRGVFHFLLGVLIREKLIAQADTLSLEKARQLNRSLYQPVYTIPPAELEQFDRRMVQYGSARGYQAQYLEDWMSHHFRLFLSQKELQGLIPNERLFTVLEMGSDSVVTDLLKEVFPQVQFISTSGDLRKRWDIADESVDLVISMEVLEHLTDVEGDHYLDGFYKDGLTTCLHETFRVLRGGGRLFATTPNAAAVNCLAKILAGTPAWYYPPHIREYTLAEMNTELVKAGFQIESARTVHCMTATAVADYTPIFQLLVQYGYELDNRGDDLFITALKPGQA